MSRAMRSFLISLSSVLMALRLLSMSLLAQVGGGSIVGVVFDPSGSIIVGARVEAINIGTNKKSETITNDQGYYEFPLLTPGRYVLSAELPGFQKATTAEITLHTGTKPKIDFQMRVGETSQTIEVIGAAPLVNATTTELGVVIDNQQVLGLPLNGRSFVHLVGLQPGVINRNAEPVAGGSQIGQRGGIEFHGSPAFGNNYLMDGVDMSWGENNALGDQGMGTGGQGAVINTVSVEAIEEFKTTSSAASAEYGRATGAVVNISTKSGTNTPHGTAFHFFRNDVLNATTFFSNRAGLKKPVLRHNQFGGNLGGPIIRDKMFYFFNYEGAQLVRGQTVTGNVPTDLMLSRVQDPALRRYLEALPRDYRPTSNPLIGFHERNDARRNKEDTFLGRVDFHLREHRLAVRFNYNHQDFIQPERIFRQSENRRTAFPLRSRNLGVQHATPLSATQFNEFRVGYNFNQIFRQVNWASDLKGIRSGEISVNGRKGGGIGTVSAPGLSLGANENGFLIETQTYTVADNFTWVHNRHSLKMGLDFRKIHTLRPQDLNPIVGYNSIEDLIANRADNVFILFAQTENDMGHLNTGLYLQDEWRINNRLQLNLGLRYEYSTVFKGPFNIVIDPFGPFLPQGSPIYNPDRNNFAPRLGMVIDLSGKGTTILRMGGGIHYSAPLPFFFNDMAYSKTLPPSVPFFAVYRRVDLPSNVDLIFPFPLTFAEKVRANPAIISLKAGRRVHDPNRRDEYAGQWNLSLQQAVTGTLAVQASYVGSRALKLLSGRELNLIVPGTGQRVMPEFATVYLGENSGNSSYHSLQLSASQRYKKGLALNAYYTWSRTMQYGNADGQFNSNGVTQDFNNMAADYGPKQSDTRHRFVFVPSYEIPTAGFAKGSAPGRLMFGDWTFQGIVNWRSGYPLNVTIGRDAIGNGRSAGQRPDSVSGVDPRVKGPDPLLWFTRAAFDVTGPTVQKRFGNLGYNVLRGPSGFWFDASLHKSFVLSAAHRIEFRFEMFNALNHVVLGQPNTNLADVNFGRVIDGSDARTIQFGLKYLF